MFHEALSLVSWLSLTWLNMVTPLSMEEYQKELEVRIKIIPMERKC